MADIMLLLKRKQIVSDLTRPQRRAAVNMAKSPVKGFVLCGYGDGIRFFAFKKKALRAVNYFGGA